VRFPISGNRESRYRESRRRSGIFMVKVLGMIRTVHLEEDAWQQSAPSGKDRQEVVDRCLDHRDIGDPGYKVFMYFGIANRETPTRGLTTVTG
jgi:hypothetical protein